MYMLCAEYRVQRTEYRVQGTEYSEGTMHRVAQEEREHTAPTLQAAAAGHTHTHLLVLHVLQHAVDPEAASLQLLLRLHQRVHLFLPGERKALKKDLKI